MPTRPRWTTTLLAAATLVLGCRPAATPEPQGHDGAPLAESAVDPALPEGHPPLPQDVVPAPPPGAGEGATGLEWRAPAGWVEEDPSSAMRKAQWKVPGEEGDGECALFYFGPGQGGDAMANAQRWANQFTLADGRPGVEGAVLEALDAAGLPILTVEVSGTYNPGMPFAGRPAEERADQMLLGAIVEGPDANWFLKCTGPVPTLEQSRSGFEDFVGSFRKGRSTTSAS